MVRKFKYENQEIPDPDPNMTVEEVRQSLVNFYPELSNAATTEKKVGADTVVSFQKRVGTKG